MPAGKRPDPAGPKTSLRLGRLAAAPAAAAPGTGGAAPDGAARAYAAQRRLVEGLRGGGRPR